MTNVTSGLARAPINTDQPPDDRHMRHVLRNLHRFTPPSTPLELERQIPTQYRIQYQFKPRKPRSIVLRLIDYITRPYP
jgi:hypothetical protein